MLLCTALFTCNIYMLLIRACSGVQSLLSGGRQKEYFVIPCECVLQTSVKVLPELCKVMLLFWDFRFLSCLCS